MEFSRHEYWSGLPFLSPVDHALSDLSTMTRPSGVALQAWLGFIQLDKAVVLVWLNWLVFCEYGFSVSMVSALWFPLATPTILLGFFLPWAWGLSSWLLQQSTATAPYLGWRLWFFQWSCMDVRVGMWRKLSAEELFLLNCGVGEDS